MDLHSDHPYFLLKNGLSTTYPPLRKSLTCEVAIIGGGISGALAAYELVRAGFDVVLIDRREFGVGSTCASTGLVMYELDAHLIDLRKQLGEDRANLVYRCSLQAMRQVDSLAISCGLADSSAYRRRKSLYLASRRKDVPALREEAAARLELGISLRFINADELSSLYSFQAHAALFSEEAGEIDAFKFTRELLTRAVALGMRAFAKTTATDFRQVVDGVQINTDRDAEIRADYVVFAAGYESEKYLSRPVATNLSTYVITTEPVASWEGWPDQPCVWESARPYLYMRTTPDNRIIAGGLDEHFTTAHRRDKRLKSKAKQLEKRLHEMLPQINLKVDYCWAGTFATTDDSLPRIGAHPEWPRARFALGYGGNGLTFSMMAAKFISADLLGNPLPEAAAFGFTAP